MYCSREMVMMVWSLLREFNYQGFVVSETTAEFQNEHELRMDVLLFDRWIQLQQQLDAHAGGLAAAGRP